MDVQAGRTSAAEPTDTLGIFERRSRRGSQLAIQLGPLHLGCLSRVSQLFAGREVGDAIDASTSDTQTVGVRERRHADPNRVVVVAIGKMRRRARRF
jgi:hypothetical protein